MVQVLLKLVPILDRFQLAGNVLQDFSGLTVSGKPGLKDQETTITNDQTTNLLVLHFPEKLRQRIGWRNLRMDLRQ